MNIAPPKTETAYGIVDRIVPPAKPFTLTVKSPAGATLTTHLQREAAEKIADILRDQSPKVRKNVLKELRGKLKSEGQALPNFAEVEQLILHGPRADLALEIIRELAPDGTMDCRLERPYETRVHALRQACKDGRVYLLIVDAENVAWCSAQRQRVPDREFGAAHVFIVEHDWASAFAGAGEFDDGHEWRLPFDQCCFEFQVSGRRVIALATVSKTQSIDVAVFMEIKPRGWLHTTAKPFDPLLRLVEQQIKAVCVSLEAEISVTEVLRAPHKLNHAREKSGKLPIADHHVIRLARRSRPAKLTSPDDVPGTPKRFHFRRGHWRHYANHKTWIKWTLVGDPDLGFVDKHYRL